MAKFAIQALLKGLGKLLGNTYVGLLFKSDDELHELREQIRLKCIGIGDNDEFRKLNRIMKIIDEISDARKPTCDNPEEGFPAHKEHGWHLPEDDD